MVEDEQLETRQNYGLGGEEEHIIEYAVVVEFEEEQDNHSHYTCSWVLYDVQN